MEQYRLKETHPTVKKVRKLEALADKLGITISTSFGGQLIIHDRDHEQSDDVQYRDIEQSIGSNDVTTSFPYFAETKLIFQKND